MLTDPYNTLIESSELMNSEEPKAEHNLENNQLFSALLHYSFPVLS